MPLLRFPARTLPALLALLSAASAAIAATPANQPGAAGIEAAFKRAIAREPLPENILARAMVESIRIDQVAGCAPMGGQLWCIVTMSGGFKSDQHRVLALSWQDGQWTLISQHDSDLPPSPSPLQAQELMRELAGKAQADGDADLRQAATELEVIDIRDCDLLSQDGSVGCELDYRLHPNAPATTGDFRFRLNGGRWQVAEPR
ncbi:hypothetical protein [Pseudoxanthomonas wuyuanensis]